MTRQLPLDDLNQAKALHRMLMVRAFDGPHAEYFGSPLIASVQHRLTDMITAAEPNQDWARWRQAEHHPHRVAQIRQFLHQSIAWSAMPQQARRQLVQDLRAALIPSADLRQQLLNV